MPTSIPFDHPSLVLGAVVDTQVLTSLDQVASLNQAIDTAQDKMNSLIMMKRSFAMTLNELLDMNIDVSSLKSEVEGLEKEISQAASDYLKVRITNEAAIQKLRMEISQIKTNNHLESPLDYIKSNIIQKPLASDSLKMDAQYFSFGSDLQDDTLANIESYVKSATSDIGKGSGDIAKQATAQIQQQHKNHSISGTLIITASCTHKNVALIEPLVLDVDKAISVWNEFVGKEGENIDISQPSTLIQSQNNSKPSASNVSLSLLSGVAYGSSFVGMVHILNSDYSGPADEKIATLNEKLQLGGWLENANGGFGVNSATLKEVKQALSTQQVSSHVSLITMGAIPTISSSGIKVGVTEILKPNSESINAVLQSTASDQNTENDTMSSSASEARDGNRILAIQNAKIQTVLQGLEKVDQDNNQVMDINSLMMAFDNYLDCIKNGEIGSPIRFFVKKVSRDQIIKLWTKKYYDSIKPVASPPQNTPNNTDTSDNNN